MPREIYFQPSQGSNEQPGSDTRFPRYYEYTEENYRVRGLIALQEKNGSLSPEDMDAIDQYNKRQDRHKKFMQERQEKRERRLDDLQSRRDNNSLTKEDKKYLRNLGNNRRRKGKNRDAMNNEQEASKISNNQPRLDDYCEDDQPELSTTGDHNSYIDPLSYRRPVFKHNVHSRSDSDQPATPEEYPEGAPEEANYFGISDDPYSSIRTIRRRHSDDRQSY